MTPKDRQRIAEHLYGECEWTMARIAEALNVAQSTITEDLRDLSTVDKSNHAKTKTNPKGAGRPKGSRSKKPDLAPAAKEPPSPLAPEPQHAPPISPPVGQTDLAGSAPQGEPDAGSEWRTPEQVDPEPPAGNFAKLTAAWQACTAEEQRRLLSHAVILTGSEGLPLIRVFHVTALRDSDQQTRIREVRALLTAFNLTARDVESADDAKLSSAARQRAGSIGDYHENRHENEAKATL